LDCFNTALEFDPNDAIALNSKGIIKDYQANVSPNKEQELQLLKR
jgi:hypothetical protein